MTPLPNIDNVEIAKFSDLAAHWWDKQGELGTLHDINPLRLGYINDLASLGGKTVIDIGCGGGILTESMATLGATVTGIDMSQEALNVAKLHQFESGLSIEYLFTTAEDMADQRTNEFDVVTCMELLEHVPDPVAVIAAVAKLVKPGGHVFFSTLNRNLKSYLFAIIGAEYFLKMLPQGTHDYSKFIRPSELAEWSRRAGLTLKNTIGIHYSPFTKTFNLAPGTDVNYIMHFKKL